MNAAARWLEEKLASALPAPAQAWLASACAEASALGSSAADLQRFAGLISLASRHVPRRAALVWTEAELAQAGQRLEGWNPERWTQLEAARARIVLARNDLGEASGAAALEEAFRHADMGEACALYKVLALLPGGERFAWRAGEGCRSSMRSVFEAAACDTPFPVRHFDALAWRQMAIKALFVEAPLWRVFGLDTRLDAELARMALDLADERRSAGRPVRPELWLCLGTHSGARGIESLERELAQGPRAGRQGAALALARAGEGARLARWLEKEQDARVAETMRAALAGPVRSRAFGSLTND